MLETFSGVSTSGKKRGSRKKRSQNSPLQQSLTHCSYSEDSLEKQVFLERNPRTPPVPPQGDIARWVRFSEDLLFCNRANSVIIDSMVARSHSVVGMLELINDSTDVDDAYFFMPSPHVKEINEFTRVRGHSSFAEIQEMR